MRVWLIILSFVVVGCGQRPTLEAPTMTVDPGIYTVTGDAVSRDDLVAKLAAARVVLIGESHDNAGDHAVQLELLEAVSAKKPTGLGMEMFQRPFQPALDLFVSGEIDEAEMLEQTEWEKRWGFEVDLYRPLWNHAQDNGLPIIALNARRELTKRIAKVGVDGLSPSERESLPELDLTDDRYRAWLGEVFASHGARMESAKLEQFYAAQVTWDETMADTAARWSQTHPDSTLVVAVGRGHVERDWGIPSRLRRRLDAQHGDGTVVSVVPVAPDAAPRWSWAQRERFADFIWVKTP